MALKLQRTISRTGAVHPNAYGRIDAASVLINDNGSLTLNWYFNAATARDPTLVPVDTDTVLLNLSDLTNANPDFVAGLAALVQAGKIASPLDALKAALYVVLKQRPAYSNAIDV